MNLDIILFFLNSFAVKNFACFQMFPKKQRIVKKKEIEKVLKTPFRTGFDFGQILLLPRKNVQNNPQTLQKNNSIEVKSDKIKEAKNNLQNLDSKPSLQDLKLSKNSFEKNCQIKIEKAKIGKVKSQEKAKTIPVCTKFRVLCIVSKKIHKKANQRNKIRRRFIAIFQDLDFQNRLPPNLDLTIIIRTKEILTAKFEDYQKIVPKVAQFYKKLKFQNKI